MNAIETIKKRRSVRTFDGTALRPEDGRKIMEFADKADNPYGIPIVWKLLDAKKNGLSSPVIIGTDTYIAGKMRRAPHAEEAFGYEFEKIVLFAEGLGVGTTWIAGTMNRDAFEKAVDVSEGEVMPCVSPLGYPANKMSLRESMMRRGIKADSRMGFGELFFDGSFDNPLTTETAGNLAGVFEAVRLAPSAVNKQPWRIVLCSDKAHFYEKRNRGYDDGAWDIQKIDMGIALCHFEIAATESGHSVSLVTTDPGIGTETGTEYIATFVIDQPGI
ncbi:MAG: nitroreductase [Clostridiales bacterium]|nr:nitroreductase [Clostridiales bacterium]